MISTSDRIIRIILWIRMLPQGALRNSLLTQIHALLQFTTN
jgi:hypothetical protein